MPEADGPLGPPHPAVAAMDPDLRTRRARVRERAVRASDAAACAQALDALTLPPAVVDTDDSTFPGDLLAAADDPPPRIDERLAAVAERTRRFAAALDAGGPAPVDPDAAIAVGPATHRLHAALDPEGTRRVAPGDPEVADLSPTDAANRVAGLLSVLDGALDVDPPPEAVRAVDPRAVAEDLQERARETDGHAALEHLLGTLAAPSPDDQVRDETVETAVRVAEHLATDGRAAALSARERGDLEAVAARLGEVLVTPDPVPRMEAAGYLQARLERLAEELGVESAYGARGTAAADPDRDGAQATGGSRGGRR